MREILFKGKSKNKKYWVYGDLIHDENGYSIIEKKGGCIKIKPETIGQYTGIKDKNGTKIFEGDIVLADFEYKDERMEVIFYQCGFKLKSKNCEYYYDYSIHDESSDLEVIGNIHDDSALLEE